MNRVYVESEQTNLKRKLDASQSCDCKSLNGLAVIHAQFGREEKVRAMPTERKLGRQLSNASVDEGKMPKDCSIVCLPKTLLLFLFFSFSSSEPFLSSPTAKPAALHVFTVFCKLYTLR